MTLNDAFFLVYRGKKIFRSKGADIASRMKADDAVLVNREDELHRAVYDGIEWTTIRDDDMVVAWLEDEKENRHVTGKNFKALFSTNILFYTGGGNMYIGGEVSSPSKIIKPDGTEVDVSGSFNLRFNGQAAATDYGAYKLPVKNLTGIKFDNSQTAEFYFASSFDTSHVSNFANIFCNCKLFVGDISRWDTTNVTNMFGAFSRMKYLGDINNWNTSNVTNMAWAFAYGQSSGFNSNISNWDVSNVTNMACAFYEDRIFNQPIGNWNVSNVTNLQKCFRGARNFRQDVANWNVSNCSDFQECFAAMNFNGDLTNWNVSNGRNFGWMFYANNQFNAGNLEKWDVSNVTCMAWMFKNTLKFNQNIGAWDVSKVRNAQQMFENAAVFNQDLRGWCARNLNTADKYTNFAYNCPLPTTYYPKWGQCPPWHGAETIIHVVNVRDGSVRSRNSDKVYYWSNWREMDTSYAFSSDMIMVGDDTIHYMSTGNWDYGVFTKTDKKTRWHQFFESCKNFNSSIDRLNFSEGIYMHRMFLDAHNFNQPVDNVFPNKGSSLELMFYNAISFNQKINWNTYNIRNMKSMFRNAYAFNGDISSFNTSRVQYFISMFENATAFNQDISVWNMKGAYYMQNMFQNAQLFNQDIGGWDLSGTRNINMLNMFQNASSFNQDLSGWCVPLAPGKPPNFDLGAHPDFEGNDAVQPQWGEPCDP
jgi:surface protein